MDSKQEIEALASSLLESGAVSDLHVLVAGRFGLRFELTGGSSAGSGKVRFDLASLTKPWVATLALVLDRRGILGLRRRVGSFWPQAPAPLARKSLASLLRHRSGLPPWCPLYALCADETEAADCLLSSAVAASAPGTYSDLGYLLWGFTVEKVTGRRLQDLLAEHVFEPLVATQAGPPPGRFDDVATSPLDGAREVELAAASGLRIARPPAPSAGVVQDGNARFLGGIAGHAGIFATAGDVLALAREWLEPSGILERDQVASALAGRGTYRLGWSLRRRRNSGGAALSRAAYGHVGFTGGSVWIDPLRGLIVVALMHRRSLAVDLLPFRQRLHRLAVDLAAS